MEIGVLGLFLELVLPLTLDSVTTQHLQMVELHVLVLLLKLFHANKNVLLVNYLINIKVFEICVKWCLFLDKNNISFKLRDLFLVKKCFI
jgi:hypothetical protein